MTKDQSSTGLLLFSLHRQWYALSLGVVKEVLPLLSLSLLPCYQPYLAGILSFRGNLLPIVHTAALLGQFGQSARQNIVLLQTVKLGMVGFLIDHGVDIVEVLHCQPQPIPPTIPKPLKSMIHAAWSYEQLFVFELEVNNLLDVFLTKTGQPQVITSTSLAIGAHQGSALPDRHSKVEQK